VIQPIYAAAPRPRRRWPLVVLVLLLAILASYKILVWHFESRLDRTFAAYRGPSLRFADQAVTPLAPGTPNGWDTLEDVLVQLEGAAHSPISEEDPVALKDPEVLALRDRLKDLERSDERPNHEDLANFQNLLDRLGPTLSQLDRPLLEVAEARYPVDLEALPYDFVLPNYLGILRIASLLRARGEVALGEGRPAAAADDIIRLYRLTGWSARMTSSMVGTLIAAAISHQADLLVASALGRSGFDREARARILAAARLNDPRELLNRAIAFEWASGYTNMMDPRMPESIFGTNGTGNEKSIAWVAKVPGWRIWLLWNAELTVRRYGAFWPVGEMLAYRRSAARLDLAEPELPRWAILARVLLDPSDDNLFARRDLWQASADHLEIAIAMEEFRERRGAYPDRLAELSLPGQPRVDPFSGEPYRYQPEENGYVLYSVGKNREDNHGERGYDGEGKLDYERGDWVWRVVK
jgi:hypothetical protein